MIPRVRLDPYKVIGPAVISFSGGRSSGFMLHKIIEAHGGTLPDDVRVCFANTGREMPATLDFVQDCAINWGIKIDWLEYARVEGKPAVKKVCYQTAAREGEPFALMLQGKRALPNPVQRFCTGELKIKTMSRWLKQCDPKAYWLHVIGFRADEPRRVNKTIKNQSRKDAYQRRVCAPMASAGHIKQDVAEFWAQQPFNLTTLGAWEGNCDGCFLKRKALLAIMFRDHPERMQWWPQQEADVSARIGSSVTFRQGQTYAEVANYARQTNSLFIDPHPDDSGLSPFDECDGGCGV